MSGHRWRFLYHPTVTHVSERERDRVYENGTRTSLFTSKRSKFCSCSGLERSRVAIKVRDCMRTYGRGSKEKA